MTQLSVFHKKDFRFFSSESAHHHLNSWNALSWHLRLGYIKMFGFMTSFFLLLSYGCCKEAISGCSTTSSFRTWRTLRMNNTTTTTWSSTHGKVCVIRCETRSLLSFRQLMWSILEAYLTFSKTGLIYDTQQRPTLQKKAIVYWLLGGSRQRSYITILHSMQV